MSADLDRAARALADGGLVAIPTETVYGLAADAENHDAVARIFQVKGRPSAHPVIVHVGSTAALADSAGWAHNAPEYARTLVESFWPGPLTVIVPRGRRAGDHVTGGLNSVGLRCPDHPVTLQLLAAFAALVGRRDIGLAAPSANLFGRVSPTSAQDVEADLGELLDLDRDLILDEGGCHVGVESTIVDCTGTNPMLLRPGAIGEREVAGATGLRVLSPSGEVRAPGMLASHYAPRATVVIAHDDQDLARIVRSASGRVGVLAESQVATPANAIRVAAPANVSDFARGLYPALRAADAQHCDVLVALPPSADSSPKGLSAAVLDRLRRAAAGRQ